MIVTRVILTSKATSLGIGAVSITTGRMAVAVKKAILLNTGGLDTLISARIMHGQGWELSSLYFDIGQLNNEVAKPSIQRIADKYCINHETIDLTGVAPFMVMKKNNLYGIPFQSGVVMMLGASYAFSKGYDYIVTGQKLDSARPAFYPALMEFLASHTVVDNSVVFIRPVETLLHITQVVGKGKELGLTFEEMAATVSCNIHPACGICPKCKERMALGL